MELQRMADIDEATIVARLAAHKNHLELTLAKMKMHAALHDYSEWVMSVANLYLTVTA